jgi:hypothetical protein
MYRSITVTDPITNEAVEHIFRDLPDGGVQSFSNIESNDGPERAAYLEWLAAGNEPEIIEQ